MVFTANGKPTADQLAIPRSSDEIRELKKWILTVNPKPYQKIIEELEGNREDEKNLFSIALKRIKMAILVMLNIRHIKKMRHIEDKRQAAEKRQAHQRRQRRQAEQRRQSEQRRQAEQRQKADFKKKIEYKYKCNYCRSGTDLVCDVPNGCKNGICEKCRKSGKAKENTRWEVIKRGWITNRVVPVRNGYKCKECSKNKWGDDGSDVGY